MAKSKNPPLDLQPVVSRSRGVVADDLAYIIPMATFLALMYPGGKWPSVYPIAYVARALIVAALLFMFWKQKQYTKIRWNHWWLGVIVGIIGIFQWVPMQLWLQNVTEGSWMHRFFKAADDPFNPFNTFSNPILLYGFIAIRIASATLWWLTSIVWAAMVAALLVYTKSLGACIIAHGVTNLLLAVYVLWTKDWAFW
jgi:hypothetical protein